MNEEQEMKGGRKEMGETHIFGCWGAVRPGDGGTLLSTTRSSAACFLRAYGGGRAAFMEMVWDLKGV